MLEKAEVSILSFAEQLQLNVSKTVIGSLEPLFVSGMSKIFARPTVTNTKFHYIKVWISDLCSKLYQMHLKCLTTFHEFPVLY